MSRKGIQGAFSLLLFLFASCATPSQKAPPSFEELREKIKQAEKMAEQGEYQKATELAQEVLNFWPGLPEMKEILALQAIQNGNLQKAKELYKELVEETKYEPRYRLALATLYLALGEEKKAYEEFQNTLDITSFPLHYPDADSGKLITSFPLPSDPSKNCCPEKFCYFWPLFFQLGSVAAKECQKKKSPFWQKKAEEFLRKVHEFRPRLSPSHQALLRLYLENKSFSKVKQLLREFSSHPEFLRFVQIASHYYYQKKELKKAISILLLALKKKEDFEILLSLGYLMLQVPTLNRAAISVLDKAIRKRPEDETALYLFSLACLREGTEQAYRWAYEPLKKLAAKNKVEYLLLFAIVCERTGKLEEAKQSLEKCLGIQGDYLPAKGNLSALLAAHGAPWSAVFEIGEEASRSPWLSANLAACYRQIGYKKTAKSWLTFARKKAKGELEDKIAELEAE